MLSIYNFVAYRRPAQLSRLADNGFAWKQLGEYIRIIKQRYLNIRMLVKNKR